MLLIGETNGVYTKMNKEYFQSQYISSNNKKVLYIHTPFCPTKCKYCICKSIACNDKKTVENYANNILKEQIMSDADFLQKIQFDQVYFGGGTPTYIPPHLLKKIFDTIPNFENITIKSIEASPNTFSEEHLALFKAYNFDFISVGIQSLQRDICKWQKRFWISHRQIECMSKKIRESGIYFNYDLIAYMGRGDFRDIPGLVEDLGFIMDKCKPSSINIHQMHQTSYSTEKMIAIYDVIRKAISAVPEYECINSRLDDEDAYLDIVHQAQYRLVREKRDFSHYMWNKYPEIPVKGYDIYAIGYIDGVDPKSNVGNIVFRPGQEISKKIEYNDDLYKDFYEIRKEKGLI